MKSHKMGIGSRQSFPGLQLRHLAVSVAATIGTLGVGMFAPHALAQTTSLSLEEIVVTARRQDENLQDIPVSVKAISGEELSKMAMNNATDVAKLAPGLNLYLPEPAAPTIVLRGVRWTPAAGTPSVPIYLNEIPFDPAPLMQAMFDMGQVEVLRGPQGTSRGAPSISGAITFSARKPDFEGVSGYVGGLAGENSHRNLEGAVNVPIIDDMLAVRVAGQFDDSLANGIKSVNSSDDPERESTSARISVRYQPTDTLTVDGMFQRLDATGDVYTQVVGTGSLGRPPIPGNTVAALPANFNGPALGLNDYKAVQDGFDDRAYKYDFYTLNAAWEVLGHTLSYNFGSQENIGDISSYSVDQGNLLVGYNPVNASAPTKADFFIHEIRLSSLRDEGNFVDYDFGYFYNKQESVLDYTAPTASLPGAYGNPFLGNPKYTPFLNAETAAYYQLNAQYFFGLNTNSESFYGHLTFHLTDATELSAGLRHITDERPADITVSIPLANSAGAPLAALGGLSCVQAKLVPSPYYSGVCDAIVDASASAPKPETLGEENSKTIWNASLSHRFNDQVLAYFTVGTSWRQGLPALGNAGLATSLLTADPESATSYEFGVKTDLASNLRVNADVFQIDYKDQMNAYRAVPYYNNISPSSNSVTTVSFLHNSDAQVQGVELEVQYVPVDNLTLGANFSFTEITSDGGEIPCRDITRPLSASNQMNFCPSESGSSLSASPEFQANINGSYIVPFDAGYEGYLRVLANFQGENDNVGTSISQSDAFTIVDLFMGVQDDEGGWDVGFYAKNVFDELTELTRNEISTGLNAQALFGASGYQVVTATLPREAGLQFRYNFMAN